MSFIFLSYSHKDSEYANRLADSLEAMGLDVWIDERIDYGSRWPHVIQENLDRCTAFVVVMTPDSYESEWVQAELTRARRLRKLTFPLLLKGDVWLALEATQYVDVRGGKLPPARFYNGLAGVLSVGQLPTTPSAGLRERLQTELDELQRRYDNLTSRIAAVDTDLRREMDGERRLTLEERRVELALHRDTTAARMAQVEAQIDQIAKPEPRRVQVEEPKPSVKQPKSSIRTEPPSAAKVAQSQTVSAELLVIEKPVRLELIRIPTGEFRMGEKDEEHRVDVAEFYIGKYPVTNAQYAAFVKAKNYGRPPHWKEGRIPAGKESHPVVDVSWRDSVAFCNWLSEATGRRFRLPTEAEWEKAARGGLLIPVAGGELGDNPLPTRQYPWGDEFDQSKCNTRASGIRDTTPVGAYSAKGGDSPYGVADMAGNVWEWCNSLYRNYPYNAKDGREDLAASGDRVLRGGSWHYYLHLYAAAPVRYVSHPDLRHFVCGFRVVVVGWRPNA